MAQHSHLESPLAPRIARPFTPPSNIWTFFFLSSISARLLLTKGLRRGPTTQRPRRRRRVEEGSDPRGMAPECRALWLQSKAIRHVLRPPSSRCERTTGSCICPDAPCCMDACSEWVARRAASRPLLPRPHSQRGPRGLTWGVCVCVYVCMCDRTPKWRYKRRILCTEIYQNSHQKFDKENAFGGFSGLQVLNTFCTHFQINNTHSFPKQNKTKKNKKNTGLLTVYLVSKLFLTHLQLDKIAVTNV